MNTIKLLFKVALIMSAITLLNAWAHPSRPTHVNNFVYIPQVAQMLSNDSIMDIHRFWGVESIADYDWTESANALDVSIDELTIDMYMDYLQEGCSSVYVRNRY